MKAISKQRYTHLLAFFVLIICVQGCVMDKDLASDLSSLVETERAFAAMSEKKGISPAFVEYFTDEAVAFRPTPIKARQAYIENPGIPGLLTWQPVFADVSAAGDLGYTTGPWELRKESMEEAPSQYGHYVSIWKKQADQTWRVVLDVGNIYSGPFTGNTDHIFPETHLRTQKEDIRIEEMRESLFEADRNLSSSMMTEGPVKGYLFFAAQGLRFYRMGAFPLQDRDSIEEALSQNSGYPIFKPMAAYASESGDLGYTYGLCEIKYSGTGARPAEYGSYLHIWKKQRGRWKIVIDVLIPVPAEAVKSLD